MKEEKFSPRNCKDMEVQGQGHGSGSDDLLIDCYSDLLLFQERIQTKSRQKQR